MTNNPKFSKTKCIFYICLFIIASLGSSCNSNNEPRLPRKKNLVQECTFSETNETARFYKSNGSHATTSDGYTVTFQEVGSKEKVVFYAYSSPGINEIRCEKESLILLDKHRDPYLLPIEWIKSELVFQPIRFYKMQLQTPEYVENISEWDNAYLPTPTP